MQAIDTKRAILDAEMEQWKLFGEVFFEIVKIDKAMMEET